MCHFRYTSHTGCGHLKRTRLSTCLGTIKYPKQVIRKECNCKKCNRIRGKPWTNYAYPACAAQHEGSDEQIILSIEGLCPQCHRDNKVATAQKNWNVIYKERHQALEALFKILGDKKPNATCDIDQQINIDGEIVSTTNRLYIDNIHVYTFDEAATVNQLFITPWRKALEKYIGTAKFIDPKWTPPPKAASMDGLAEACVDWFLARANTDEVKKEFYRVQGEVADEDGRVTMFKWKKYKTDPPNSIRCHLPFEDSVSPKPKSKLRNEIKAEDR